MREHGSVLLYVHGNQKAPATSTLTQLLNYVQFADRTDVLRLARLSVERPAPFHYGPTSIYRLMVSLLLDRVRSCSTTARRFFNTENVLSGAWNSRLVAGYSSEKRRVYLCHSSGAV